MTFVYKTRDVHIMNMTLKLYIYITHMGRDVILQVTNAIAIAQMRRAVCQR